MIKVLPFKIEDFDRMEIKDGAYPRREDRYLFEAYSKHGPAITIFNYDLVIACGGVACAWPGFGEAWILPSIHVKRFKKAFFKVSLGFMEDVFDQLKLRRLQATIREQDKTSIRWINAMGFQREGLLRKFGQGGENHFMYARVK